MLILYFSNNTSLKFHHKEINSFDELKKKIIENKFKSDNLKLSDITLITKGNIINENNDYNVDENQTFLVIVNINIEFSKFINDERLVNIINDEKTRKIMYKILENPSILEKLNVYKYQKELDEIYSMGMKYPEDKIKFLLNKHNGNLGMVMDALFN